MAPQRFGHPRVGIGVFAQRVHFFVAHKAAAARDWKRDHDAIAGFQIVDRSIMIA
jgi:hypothetical protein